MILIYKAMAAKKGWSRMAKGKKQPSELFQKIAAQNGVSADEVARELQALLDATWDNPDPAARKKQRALFPNGKPSVEEFIRVLAKQTKS